jgi:D-cysteine desulfhydrase
MVTHVKTIRLLVGVLLASAWLGLAFGARPLFDAYPELQEKIAWVKLANLPTPIKKLDNLGRELGVNNLYVKLDNVTNPTFGGNKVRKLEFLFGQALQGGYAGVATDGCYGTNHGCATAVHAHQLGLKCHLFLTPQPATSYLRRNLKLDYYYGAELHCFANRAEREAQKPVINQAFKAAHGTDLYFIPVGGSNVIGALGFVNAAFELKEQIDAGLMPMPDIIYVTLGSCGTAAGIIVGCKAAGLTCKIVPVSVELEWAPGVLRRSLSALVNELDAFLAGLVPGFPPCAYDDNQVTIEYNFVGTGYAKATAQAQAAIQLLENTEQIKLDGTYTGKTFAALLAHIQADPELKNKTILFWDTFCNGEFTEITSQVDYKLLPEALHAYFEGPLEQYDAGV